MQEHLDLLHNLFAAEDINAPLGRLLLPEHRSFFEAWWPADARFVLGAWPQLLAIRDGIRDHIVSAMAKKCQTFAAWAMVPELLEDGRIVKKDGVAKLDWGQEAHPRVCESLHVDACV